MLKDTILFFLAFVVVPAVGPALIDFILRGLGL